MKERVDRLKVPEGKIDVVIDTDAYNEIDDQFAISYLLRSNDKLNTVAIYAAPFLNEKSTSPKDGMEKSYCEILKLLDLAGAADKKGCVRKGSETYLTSETEPVHSPAAEDLCIRVQAYSSDNPLYVVAIGAITNIASALLINPKIKEKMVVVWLGGHAHSFPDTKEFNMYQDIAAVRVVMGSGVPFVQLPCDGVVSEFRISKPELKYWLCGKNDLADYLAQNTIKEAESYACGEIWTRVIWDVAAVAWLLNEKDRFMLSRIIPTPVAEYNHTYTVNPDGYLMCYVYKLRRDELMNDLIHKLL